MAKLLTREAFRNAVFERDEHTCVVCSAPAVDAHHLMERKLWPDGGYYLDNGVSLCEQCHRNAEANVHSPDYLRACVGITQVLLPPQLTPGGVYDKWGEARYWKYPRTPHLPWSPGASPDDVKVVDADELFGGKEVVVTEKMDGENTTMYSDHIHARSLDSGYHPSRTWVKNLHASIAHEIPSGWRIVGENLQAKHAIQYTDLSSYFMVISIWNEENVCLSWDDTIGYADLLDLRTVPVRYKGWWVEAGCMNARLVAPGMEGYVVRNAAAFHYADFQKNVAKWVRPNHVTADTQNWQHKPMIPNLLES